MKKTLALFLLLALVICLCACGSNPEAAAVKKDFDKAVKYTESIIDTDKMTSSVREKNDGIYLTKFWRSENDENIMDIGLDVEVNGHIITLGKTKVSEIRDMGFEINSGFETLKPGEAASISIAKDGKYIPFDTDTNETDAEISIDDMTLSAFIGEVEEDTLPYSYKGFKPGSSLQEVVDAIGAPNYAASLSTDSDGTRIAMDYLNESTEGDKQVAISLMMELIYNVETDSSELVNFQIDCVYDQPEKATE